MLSSVPASVAASGPLSFSEDVLASPGLTSQFDTSVVTVPQSEASAGLARANEVLASLLNGSDYEIVIGDVFGRAGTDSVSFSSAVSAVKADWSAGRLGVEVQAVPGAAMGAAMGAYAASYAGGQRIFINADWLASAPGVEKVAKVLLEEFGHSLDQRLNAGVDSPGDEGELFAFAAEGGVITPDIRSAAFMDFDQAVLQIGATPVSVEVAAVQSTTDTDGDGVVDGTDLDDDNDGISDAVESTRAGATPLSPETVAFTYAQTAGVDGYVAGYPSRHDAASVYKTGDRNDPAFLFDGKLDTELRVHQGDIFEFRFGGTVGSPRVIKAGSGFTLTEGSGGNDRNVDVYGSFGTTDSSGNTNNATGGGMGWKNLQTMIANGNAVLLYSGSSAATQSFTTSIDITHFQVVGRGTHGGWADLAVTSDVDATLDTDGDGVANRLDLDSDNDGISDLRESVSSQPSAAVIVADANNNGTITSAEAVAYMTANVGGFTASTADANSNGVWNFLESGGAIGTPPADTDAVGLPDFLDLDSDNDGIPDTVELRATTPYTANDGDVRNDDADGDGVIGLFDTVVGFGGSFSTPVNTDGTAETDAGVPTGSVTALSYQKGLSWTGGNKDYTSLQSSDGDTTYVKIKEATDRLVVDLGQTLPKGSVVTVRAQRRGTVNVVVSQSNAGGSTLTNSVTFTSTTLVNTNTYYDLAYTLNTPTRYINIDNTAAVEIRVTSVLWSYPANTLKILPDYIDTDSDDDGVMDKNESGLARTGGDANGDGIDDGISASYQDPDGVVNAPLTTLQNTDSVTAEVDYRSVETNPLRITSLSVNEGSPYGVFTLSGRTTDTNVKLSLTTDADPYTVNATVGTDTGSTIEWYDNKNGWSKYTDGNTVKLSANKSLLVRVPITNDTTYEGPEAFRLKATYGGTNNDASEGTGGIGTIYDDGTGDYWAADNNTATPALPSGISLDDDRAIDISDISVNEGSPYGVFEIAAPVGAVLTLSLAATSNAANTIPGNATIGTDTGTGSKSLQYSLDDGATWTDYTWNGSSGNRPTMPDGTLLEVRVAITNDSVLEIAETFKLNATRVSGSTTIKSTGGLGTIRDDGQGDYWIGSSIAPATEAELTAASITLDDDTPIEVFDVTVNELTGWAVFALEGQSGQSYTPSLSTTGTGLGHAATVSDYTSGIQYWDPTANSNKGGWVAYTSGTIALDSAGDGLLRVAIVNDSPAVFEGPETFKMNVTTSSNVTSFGLGTILDDGNGLIFGTGTTADETVTKDNDKPTVSIAASPAGISEGDGAETDVITYTVTLSGTSPWATVVTIDLTGTATLTTDYSVSGLTATGTAGRYTLTIAAGQTTGTFTVDPVGDTTYEGAETVIATVVSAVTNSTVSLTTSTSSATGTIYDDGSAKPGGGNFDNDKPTVSIAASPVGISEGDGAETDVITYTVTLTNASATATTITIDLTGTATLGTDYTVSGLTATGTAGRYTLTIAAGQTTGSFAVDPVGDTTFEGAETVIATIFSAVTNTNVSLTATTSSATGTIYDDGSPNPDGGNFDNDSVPVAVDNAYTINEDASLSGKNLITDDNNGATAGGVDSDASGKTLTLHSVVLGQTETLFSNLPNGSGGRTGWKVLALANGTAYLKQDGTFEYSPAAHGTAGDTFGYKVTNGQNVSAAASVSVAVNPVNDAPAGQDKTVIAHQNEPLLITDSNFGFSDVDGNNRLSVIVTTLPAAGTLQYKNGSNAWVSVTTAQEISFDDIMDGRLRFVPVNGAAVASPYTSFTFQVRDDGGTANGGQDTDQSPNTLTINLLDARGPKQTVPLEQTIDEDAALVFSSANSNAISIAFIGEDGVDNDVETIRTTLSVTAGTLTLGSLPAGLSVTGDGTTSIVMEGLRSKVNAALDGLRFDAGANVNSLVAGGKHTLTTLTVTTVNVPAVGGFLYAADTDTVDIGVRPVNDAPVASGSATLAAVDEDTTNPPGATVATLFTGNFSDANDEVDGGSSANTLAGIAIVGYTADASKGVWQYSSNGSTWTTLSNVTGDATAFTLEATDSLRFVPAADYFGSVPSLTVRLIDSSTTVTTAATVNVSANGGTTAVSAATVVLSTTVDPVNDAPVPTYGDNLTATEDGATVSGQLTSTDIDNVDPPTYAVEGDPIPGLTINSDGSFSFDPKDTAYQGLAVGETRVVTVTYRVTDDQGGYATRSFTITVTGIDDLQTGISLTNSTIPENSAVGTVVGGLRTADADVSDTFTYSLVSGTGDTDNDKFEIVNGQLRAKQSFDFENPVGAAGNAYSIRVRSTADLAGRNPATLDSVLTVTVLNVLEKLTIALVTDSRRDDVVAGESDKITNVGAVRLGGTGGEIVTATSASANSGIQYSIDDGSTWTGSFSPVQGENTLRARQVDPAGILAPSPASDAFTFTLDTIARIPAVTLRTDTGSSSSDKVTSDGELVVSGIEADARVEYSVNGGVSWSPTFTAAVGLNSLRVRQVDIAGNQSDVATFVFTYDDAAVTPTVTLSSDTGVSATDNISRVGLVTVGGIETGARFAYSTNGGASWTSSFSPVAGSNTVVVRQTDVAGNSAQSDPLTFWFDTAAAAPIVALVQDTGTSSSDRITSDGSLEIRNAETDARIEYSTNGGATWGTSFTPVVGLNTVRVRQIDKAGNVSPSTTFSFTLDGVALAPRAVLTSDSGLSTTDRITRLGGLTLTGVETGATVQYSKNGGGWLTSFTPDAGLNNVKVRQIDVAGNTSPEASLDFTLDTAAPATPTVALTNDTGTSNSDGYTRIGTLSLGDVEAGAKVEYQLNTSTAWTTTLTPVQGVNTVKVRQTDVAGNVSGVESLTFTFDSVVAAPVVVLGNDSGKSATDRITNDGTLRVTNAETDALVEYSPNGTSWRTDYTPVAGLNTVRVRQTDKAANVSAVTTFSFTYDTVVATPQVSLASDTGLSTADRITRIGTLKLTGVETGAAVEYSADGATGWVGSFVPGEDVNTVYVRQRDVAGNVSGTSSLTFTLDTGVPAAPTVALTSDTGTNNSDGYTWIGTLVPGGVEAGARVEYQLNASTSWTTAFAAVPGSNTVKVRQTDVAGNVSNVTQFVFTFDNVAAAPVVSLVTDTGVSATDKITSDGTLRVANAEADALVEYSPNGTTWSTSYVAVPGANTVRVRQTDKAANVSAVTTFTFTLDTVAPEVSKVTVPSAGTYAVGSTLRVTLTFSKAVHVTGSPSLQLTFGSAVRNATYLSGSGTTSIVFAYTVLAGDTGLGVLTAVANSVNLGGGTLKGTSGVDASSSLSGKLPAILPRIVV